MSIEFEASSAAYPGLLTAARGGDETALAKLLDADRDYLLLIAEAELESGLRVKASQSDLVQDTMLEAQQSFQGFRGTSSLQWQQWLRAILKNNIKDLRRRYVDAEKRNIRKEVEDANGEHEGNSKDSPSQQFVRKEEIQQLGEYLNELPDHYQQVLRLRFWQQMSYEEIAAETGSTAEAVRKSLYRAVEALINVFELRKQ
ncbi:MAG TPA: sigma-70 family RNA polymerase sigma factor [Planctomycetes bacterium]|nr:sigma-70 family RNA polymerase sigma factor [Fuerstiella sp.]HIK96085.1 sigma-70 family RNA polymerase sigma factor [Planctomycetota bacterium]